MGEGLGQGPGPAGQAGPGQGCLGKETQGKATEIPQSRKAEAAGRQAQKAPGYSSMIWETFSTLHIYFV